MPTPKAGESEKDFVDRCIPIVMNDGSAEGSDQAVAMCHSMFKDHQTKALRIAATQKGIGYVAAKSISDAPNLRDRFNAACCCCKYFQAIAGAMDNTGVCTLYEFPAQGDWVCDSFEAMPPPDVAEQVAEAIVEAMPEMAGDGMMSYGGEIKSLGNGHIGGYLVRFGSPQDTDAEGEYFDATTDYGFQKGEEISSPVWLNHCQPLQTSNGKAIAVREPIGQSTLKMVDDGIVIDAILYERAQYEKLLDKLGWSSGTADHTIKRVKNGKAIHIARWHLGLDASVTPKPGEPRNAVVSIKSLTQHPKAEAEAGVLTPAPQATVTASNVKTTVIAAQSAEEKKEMEKAELEAALAPLVSKVDALAEETAKNTKALKQEPANGGAVGYQVEPDEKRPYKSIKTDKTGRILDATGYGEFLQDVQRAETERSVSSRLAQVHDASLKGMKATGLNVAIPSQGGFFAQTDHSQELVRNMFSVGSILNSVRYIGLGPNADSVTINGVDETSRASTLWGGIVAYWVAEATAPTATKPKFREIRLEPKGLSALYYATDKLLRVAPALGSLVAEGFREAMTFKVEDAIINGNGAGKPLGLLAAPLLASGGSTVSVAKETGQGAATVLTTNLSNMWARMFSQSKANAVWLINTDTNPQLDELSIAAGTAALEPRFVNYGPDGLLRIKGRQVMEVEHCMTLGTQGDIILWDPSTYLFTDLGAMAEASSIHVAFTTAETAFRFLYYCDGQPQLANALTPAHGNNTLSTQVVLDTRS